MTCRSCILLVLVCLVWVCVRTPVSSCAASQVSSLDVVSTIAIDKEPLCISVNEETNRVYVGVEDGLMVFDGATKQVLTTIQLNETSSAWHPEWVVADSVNNRIFVGSTEVCLHVFDGVTNSILRRLPLVIPDRGEFALDPRRNRMYIASPAFYPGEYDCIEVYETNTWTMQTEILIPESSTLEYVQHLRVAVDTELNRIYAEWSFNHEIFLFDGTTHTLFKARNLASPFVIIGTMLTDEVAMHVFNPPMDRVYLGGGKTIIDGTTLEEVSSLDFDFVTAFNPYYPIAYACTYDHLSSKYEFQVADAYSNVISASLNLKSLPHSAVNAKTGEIYLTQSDPKEILLAKFRYSVETDGSAFSVSIVSNSTIFTFAFNQPLRQLSFNVAGESGSSGFCNVTFPTQLLGGPYDAEVNGQSVPPIETSNDTHTSLYLTYTCSSRTVQIIGKTAIPEFPTIMSATLILITLSLGLLFSRRRLVRHQA